jgi:hypothetical protein
VADLQAHHPDVYNYFIGAHNGHFIATNPGLLSLFTSGEDLQADANGNKTAQGAPVLWASIPSGYSDAKAADTVAALVQQKWGRDFLRWKAAQTQTGLSGDQAAIPPRDPKNPLADWEVLRRQEDRDFGKAVAAAKATAAQRLADREMAQALVEARQAAGAPPTDPVNQFINGLAQDAKDRALLGAPAGSPWLDGQGGLVVVDEALKDQLREQRRVEQLAGAYQQAQHLHALHGTPEVRVADFLQSLAMPFTSQAMGLPGSDPWVTAETIDAYRQQGKYHPLLNPTCDQEALRQWAYENRFALLADAVFAGMDLLGGIGAAEGVGALLERGLARIPAAAVEAEVAPAAQAGLRPSNFGLRTIAEDPAALRMWNEAMRSAANASRPNGYTRYLQAVDRGDPISKQMLDEAFQAVNSRFLESYRGAGNQAYAVHHWNFNRNVFPDQVLDPRNLVPVPNRAVHEAIHRATSSTMDIWGGPISPLHQIPIPDVSIPLAP